MDWTTALLFVGLRVATVQPRISESVTVVAERSLSGAGSATVLTREALASAPALALDDVLRSTPGFTLFRRASSRVANPTTQGTTLRGLAASGASRAAVLFDEVPLTDPVGGWIYWNQVPTVAVGRVEVVRGPAGDLAADAIGGSITAVSTRTGAGLLAEGGGRGTARVSAYAAGPLSAAAEWFTTDGYTIVAPESRGPIDTHASSRHVSAHLSADVARGHARFGRVAGAFFDESRGNGTPFQSNATRRAQLSGLAFVIDLAGGYGMVGSYGILQRYEQTFSAVLPGRESERPTREQQVDAGTAEAWMDWGRAWRTADVSIRASGRYVGADLLDRAVPAVGDEHPLEARQMTGALSAHGSLRRWDRVTLAAGLRADAWRSSRPQTSETTDALFLSPRLSAAFAVAPRISLRAGLQSGSRAPTINELYRGFRVGSVITLPNAALTPEHATGLEISTSFVLPRRSMLRVVGFWSRVDDAIVNVTQPSSDGLILRQRMNAARIRARGAEVEGETHVTRALALTASAVLTDSRFDRGPLEGLRVPQVPRAGGAVGVRGAWSRARLAAEWRFIGEQFDDDRNAFALGRSAMLDVRAGWLPRRGVEVFAAVENVLDEEQDVGRTPLRTIGLPRTARIGIRVQRW